ncbi:MAG: tripartite tricarboxylate transporter substrate binding protein [Burkholderiaceae bacterium]|jgi:tripartite-type tricarboxylate transporter receptor subunit TctC|nr:tripartite tricarboxylate transporter substrate binding protein [Burkholderiaceae bacterium]
MRRAFHRAALLAAAACLLSAPGVHAQKYPDKPVRVVVPSAAGGAPDALTRLLMAELSKALGQQFVVDNKPGASGQIGMREVASAAPDGYTLGYANVVTMAINRSLLPKLNYDPDKDFAPVALVGFTQNLLVVNSSVPVKSVKELIEYARQRPGKLNMASAGNGTTSHLGGELFKAMSGTFLVHIPYRGSPAAIQDLIGGQAQVMFDNIASIGPHVASGRVRALAVSGESRSPLYPDLPTIAEAGVPGYATTAWGGFVAPARTPPAIVQQLNTALNRILSQPEMKQRLAALGFETHVGPPEDLTALARKEAPMWADVVKRSGARVD